MSTDLVTVENFAQLFHHYYRALAPDFGGNPQSGTEWEDLSSTERRHLVAATRLALLEAESHSIEVESLVRGSKLQQHGTEGRECGC